MRKLIVRVIPHERLLIQLIFRIKNYIDRLIYWLAFDFHALLLIFIAYFGTVSGFNCIVLDYILHQKMLHLLISNLWYKTEYIFHFRYLHQKTFFPSSRLRSAPGMLLFFGGPNIQDLPSTWTPTTGQLSVQSSVE